MTTILHVDDHPVIKAAMKHLIKGCVPHAKVDEAHNMDSTLERISGKEYDMILLDISMQGTDTMHLVREILAARPGLKILMFTGHNEDIYAKEYFQIGIRGYITKDADIEDIEKAITTVLRGELYASPELTAILIDAAVKGDPFNPFDLLSKREFEIAQHLMKGESVVDISKGLDIHTSTVGTMKGRIFAKLNCNNVISLNTLAELNHVKTA
jgi:two-component system, NarL family, invasion response regulator UvrY